MNTLHLKHEGVFEISRF